MADVPAGEPAATDKPAADFPDFSFDGGDNFAFDFSSGGGAEFDFGDENPFAADGDANPFGETAGGTGFASDGADAVSAQAAADASAAAAAAAIEAEEDEDPNAGHLDSGLDPDEDTVWSNRGKLYRLDKAEKAWKERGTGLLKVLKHKEHGTFRIVMRRDKILTLCANHKISDDVTFKKNQTNACLWTIRDFTDDPTNGNLEVLSMKFESEEIADEFIAKAYLK